MIELIIGIIVVLLWLIASIFITMFSNTNKYTGSAENKNVQIDPFDLVEYNNDLERLKILKDHMSVNKTLERSFPRIYFKLNYDGCIKKLYPVSSDKFQEYLDEETTNADVDRIELDPLEIPLQNHPKPDTTPKYSGDWVEISDIKLHKNQYELLRKKFVLDSEFEDYAYIISKFYIVLGGLTFNMSVPPKLLNDFEFDHELFGSPINTEKDYCSPLGIEKVFGSSGNFFDYEFESDKLYVANPPFDEQLMKDMALKLVDEKNDPINCVITIPVWDSETQKKLGDKDYNKDFDALTILKKYATKHVVLSKNESAYYSYYQNRIFPVVSTHVILLGKWSRFNKFIDEWKRISHLSSAKNKHKHKKQNNKH